MLARLRTDSFPDDSPGPRTRKRPKRYEDAYEEPEPTKKKVKGRPSGAALAAGELYPELQTSTCRSSRYENEEFPRCIACVRRAAGDTCRFQDIRYLCKDPDTWVVKNVSFVNERTADPHLDFPLKWNVPLESAHTRTTKRAIARALLPALELELEHHTIPDLVARLPECDVRATCGASWMCVLCGREACADCYNEVERLHKLASLTGKSMTPPVKSPTPPLDPQQPQPQPPPNPHRAFLLCVRGEKHVPKLFVPVTRFTRPELELAIQEMNVLLKEPLVDAVRPVEDAPVYPSPVSLTGGPSSDPVTPVLPDDTSIFPENTTVLPLPNDTSALPVNTSALPDSAFTLHNNTSILADGTSVLPNGNPELPQHVLGIEIPTPFSGLDPEPLTPLTSAFSSPAPEPRPALPDTPSHETPVFADDALTEPIFREHWARGLPIMVTGLLPKFRIQWTPQYFIDTYGNEPCVIVECQTHETKSVNVGEFFRMFGRPEGRMGCWKLKDWPPSTDFKTTFPELYEDFSRAVPMPNYCRLDGVLNIASHFPTNTVVPDLGPKMYNAMATFETEGAFGSTRLHMDMADAVNVMLHAEACPDGRPGMAAWDLFRAEDSETIRAFLRRKFPAQSIDVDPIHAQQVYLDSTLRQELYETTGVKSHRVYQRPGEAIFIPAGCAHQAGCVCNLSDLIKVAVDFVSPENIARCAKLTEEFRAQNLSQVWKEDVLQLRTMMWYAWVSCTRHEAAAAAAARQ
ncbi:hypothetical protein EWM64_g8720 [Hericium alpestre]|uniref:JmjC domain-containing protein n=1 Tax=Hericium alpestre TaxID=135208 RepID=A0A4Y9ZKM5_9AGAM|nr:hypothetical protein EWM64_g8720 [Hericium alpestre]